MIKEKLEKLIYKCGILIDRIESIEYHAELNYRDTTNEEDLIIKDLENELDKTIKKVEKLRKKLKGNTNVKED